MLQKRKEAASPDSKLARIYERILRVLKDDHQEKPIQEKYAGCVSTVKRLRGELQDGKVDKCQLTLSESYELSSLYGKFMELVGKQTGKASRLVQDAERKVAREDEDIDDVQEKLVS